VTIGGQGPYFGTFNGKDLKLNVPTSSGTLAASDFHAATAADYNAAVRALQRQVALANSTEQQRQAQAQAAQQAAQQQAAAAQQAAQAAQAEAQRKQNAAVEATQQKSCAAVGGQLAGAPGVNYCAPVSGKTTPGTSGGVPFTCAGLSLNFQPDGTISQSDIRSENESYPGCFG
jgi:multidrug efflux pump subunit AcrA (membrane-fusion protein)